MDLCISNFYIALLLYVGMSNIIYYIAMKHVKDIKKVFIIKVFFEIILLLSMPLSLILGQGMCN